MHSNRVIEAMVKIMSLEIFYVYSMSIPLYLPAHGELNLLFCFPQWSCVFVYDGVNIKSSLYM